MDIKLIIDELKKEKEKLESRIEKINSVIRELESIDEEGPSDTKESIEKVPRKKFYQSPTFAEIRKRRGRPKKVSTTQRREVVTTKKGARQLKYTPEVTEFLRNNVDNMTHKELVKEVNRKFKIDTTYANLYALMTYRNIKRRNGKRGLRGPYKKKDIPERKIEPKIEPAYYHGQKLVCPKCGSLRILKDGTRNGIQRFKCGKCSRKFFLVGKNESSKDRTNRLLAEEKEANREGLEEARNQKPFSMDEVPEGMEGNVEE